MGIKAEKFVGAPKLRKAAEKSYMRRLTWGSREDWQGVAGKVDRG